MAYRKVPREFTTTGAVTEADAYIAELELVKLEREVKLSRFPGQVKQFKRTRRIGDLVVECWHRFGLSGVSVSRVAGAKEEVEVSKKECFCLPCFAAGWVTAVTIVDPCSYYDVEICQKLGPGSPTQIGKYIVVSNVVALDYAQYEVGQPVLVSIVPGLSGAICGCATGLSMCEVSGLDPTELPSQLCIVPIHVEDPAGAYWRIPRWKQVKTKWWELYV